MRISLLTATLALVASATASLIPHHQRRGASVDDIGSEDAALSRRAVTSCPTGLILYAGRCIFPAKCPSGAFGDTKTQRCRPCGDKHKWAATCTEAFATTCKLPYYMRTGTCVEQCPSGTFLKTGTRDCIGCTVNFPYSATCTEKTLITCRFTHLLVNGKCVLKCGVGKWLDTNTLVCNKCTDKNAASCTGTKTLTCNSGFTLTEGVCVATIKTPTCAGDEYLSDNTCLKCSTLDTNALTCSKDLGATSCATGFKVANKVCTAIACASTEFLDGSDCKSCTTLDPDASACTKADGVSACLTGYFYKKACQPSCPAATYADETTKQCIACEDGVSECSANSVTSCGITSSGTQLYLENGKCVATCADGTYGTLGSTETTTPADPMTRRVRKRADAPAGHICAACPDGVATCTSATVALTCTKNSANVQTYLNADSTSCVVASGCPPLTWPSSVESKFTCAACPDGSTACDVNGRATACGAPKLLSSGSCVDKCPLTTFKKAGACAACGPWATECISVAIATACGTNNNGVQMYLLNGKCAPKAECPSWGYISEPALACKRCDTFSIGSITCNADGALTCGQLDGVQTYLTANRNCVAAPLCPSATWANSGDNTCTACDEGTKTCSANGAGKATECLTTSAGDAFYLDTTTNTCTKTCPEAYFPDSLTATCLACDDGEKVCTKNGEGSAVICKSGKYLTPTSDCVTASGCASLGAYYGNDATVDPVCSVCDEGVLACTGTGSGTATKCGVKADVQLFLDPTGNCVVESDCPLGTFVNTADNTCTACGIAALVCTSPTNALVCGTLNDDQYYLDSGKCVLPDNCSVGRGPEMNLDVCQDCPKLFSHSVTCSGTEAKSCDKSTFLYSGACINTCPAGTYADETNRKCVSCKTAYGQYTNTCTPTQVSTCVSNTYQKYGQGACDTCEGLWGAGPFGIAACNGNGVTQCYSPSYRMIVDNVCRNIIAIIPTVNLKGTNYVAATTRDQCIAVAASGLDQTSWYQNKCTLRDADRLYTPTNGATGFMLAAAGRTCANYAVGTTVCNFVYVIGTTCYNADNIGQVVSC